MENSTSLPVLLFFEHQILVTKIRDSVPLRAAQLLPIPTQPTLASLAALRAASVAHSPELTALRAVRACLRFLRVHF